MQLQAKGRGRPAVSAADSLKSALQRGRTIAGPGNAVAAVRAGERAWPWHGARTAIGNASEDRDMGDRERRRNVGKKKIARVFDISSSLPVMCFFSFAKHDYKNSSISLVTALLSVGEDMINKWRIDTAVRYEWVVEQL
jgi:hypothetical protein